MDTMIQEIVTMYALTNSFQVEDACYNGAIHPGGAPAYERNAPDLQAPTPSHEVHPGDQRPCAAEPDQRGRGN
jgi:hypothetical protein